MSYINSSELYSQWQTKKFLPVYIFAGEENFLQEEAIRCLKEHLNPGQLNSETFYGNETSAKDIITAFQTLPFISDKRLLIVKDSHRIKSAEIKKLSESLNNPIDSSCLVFLWNDKIKKEIKNSDLFCIVNKIGAIVEFRQLYERELSSWITQKVKQNGKNITNEVVQYLINESGTNLLDVSNEIEKLCLFIGNKTNITLRDAEMSSGHTKKLNLYEFSFAIESKNKLKTISILEGLLNEGEIPLKILSTIYRVIKRLLIAKSLIIENKLTQEQVRNELRLHKYFDRNFFSNLSRFAFMDLNKYIDLILKADLELKTSTRPEQLILEELVLSIVM